MVIEERREAGLRKGTTNGRITPAITDADIDLSENARVVLEKRYLRKDAKGRDRRDARRDVSTGRPRDSRSRVCDWQCR